MIAPQLAEAAFEIVIEDHLPANSYRIVPREGFSREQAVFPDTTLAFIQETQPAEWAKPESLLGANMASPALSDHEE